MLSLWRAVRNSPIYRRELGIWGEPNPMFARFNRFAPFIILGALVLGLCGANNFITGLTADLATVWILVCLPNFAIQAITWTGIILIPSLTAPAISSEVQNGTWDMLRLTPQPTWFILLAKLLGALARLKIWWPLLVFNLLQVGAVFVGTFFTLQLDVLTGTGLSFIFWNGVLALGMLARPWFEMAFAALVGLNFSTFTTSTRTALVGTYAIILSTRLINSSTLWGLSSLGLFVDGATQAEVGSIISLGLSSAGPAVTYMGLIGISLLLLMYRAEHATLQRAEL